MKYPIYFDYMATTPMDKRVKKKMEEFLTIDDKFGNPSSSSHIYGQEARDAVEIARTQVANLINASPQEITWTSCATEANNMAIRCGSKLSRREGKHIITCASEHKSVLNTCKFLQQKKDYRLTIINPEKNGLIDLNKLNDAICDDTTLVSIMHVNNEIGVIQNIKSIGSLLKPHDIIFHVDAVQSAGKIQIDVRDLPVDLMSFSAHKVYGPKGIGCLYTSHNSHKNLEPLIFGGGQESGVRSGTLPVHQIAAMGAAFDIAKNEMKKNIQHITGLRNRLWEGIKTLDDIYINGDFEQRIPHNLSVAFGGIPNGLLVKELKNLAISTSSACVSSGSEPSYVLRSIGLSDQLAINSIRLSIGNFTTKKQIDYAIKCIVKSIRKLRKIRT